MKDANCVSLFKACFIYFTTEISVMGRTKISIMERTDRNFCTPHYRNFWRKVDETSSNSSKPKIAHHSKLALIDSQGLELDLGK